MKLLFESWRQYLNEASFIQSILDKEPYPFSRPIINTDRYSYSVKYEFESIPKTTELGGAGKRQGYQVNFSVDVEEGLWYIQFNAVTRKRGRNVRNYDLTHGRDVARVMSTIVHIIHNFVFSEVTKGPPADPNAKIRGIPISNIRTFKFSGAARDKESTKQGEITIAHEKECEEEYGRRGCHGPRGDWKYSCRNNFVSDCTKNPENYFDDEDMKNLDFRRNRIENDHGHRMGDDAARVMGRHTSAEREEMLNRGTENRCSDIYDDKIKDCLKDSLRKDPLPQTVRTKIYVELLKAKLPGVNLVVDPFDPNDISFTLPPQAELEEPKQPEEPEQKEQEEEPEETPRERLRRILRGRAAERRAREEEELPGQLEEAASEYVYGVKNPGRVANIYRIKIVKK
jgi:hypothetical protein